MDESDTKQGEAGHCDETDEGIAVDTGDRTVSGLSQSAMIGQEREKHDGETKVDTVFTDCNEDQPQTADKSKIPDGGWGWMVVLGSFVGHLFLVGLSRSLGVVYVALLEIYNGSAVDTAMVFSLYNAIRMILGPAAGIAADRFSCRTCLAVGSVATCLGFVMSSQATELYHVQLAFGVFSGIGSSLLLTPMMIIVGQYFDKKKGIAMSISTVGSGIGAVTLSPLMAFLLKEYALRGTFIIMGGLVLHCAIAGALFRPLHIPNVRDKDHRSHVESFLKTFSVLKNPTFLLYGTNIVAMPFCAGGALTFLPALALEKGATTAEGAMLLAISGLSDVVGRLGSGILFDRQYLRDRRRLPHSIMGIAAGACVFSWGLMPGYYSLAVMVAVWGIFEGGFHAQRATVLSEIVPMKDVPFAVGMITFFQGIGHLVCPLTGALIEDRYHSYALCYYYFGIFMMTACGLFLMQYILAQYLRRRPRSQRQNGEIMFGDIDRSHEP